MSDLLFTPAVKAAALIRAKKLSPVDYLDAVLKAVELPVRFGAALAEQDLGVFEGRRVDRREAVGAVDLAGLFDEPLGH